MKSAKGSLDVKDTIETMAFVGGVLGMMLLLFGAYVQTGMIYQDSYKKMMAVEVSHSAEECFMKAGNADGYLSSEFLDYTQRIIPGPDLEDLCGIDAKASVQNLESNKIWEFGGDVKDP
jgi:hypothetical protein